MAQIRQKQLSMILGAIADDFTGASDLANTLSKGGMSVVQFVGVPDEPAPQTCEAGIVSLKSRTIPAGEAVAQSLAALDWLLAQGCRQILFKYCSTFDSTPKGNIGPVAEALLDRLGVKAALVCPVFPATGRTLFQGHLFVGGQLLSQSGMQNHPLTPMTDPDIRRWLSLQCRSEAGLVPYGVVREGMAAIRQRFDEEAAMGRRLVVVDAVVDDDLRAIAEAAHDHRLITGGSGIALGLPEIYRRQGLLSGGQSRFRASSGPAVALSGSCSMQSLKQVAAFTASHPGLAVLAGEVMDATMTAERATAWALERIDAIPMIYSSADPAIVAAAQRQYGTDRVAQAVEALFGDVALRLTRAGVTRMAVGGGETSGAVVTALGVRAFAIGPEIDPGVPALSVEGRDLALALKSGNFGGLDFYEKALAALSAGGRHP